MNGKFCVYILTNESHSMLHIGITDNLTDKMVDYRNGSVDKLTKQHGINKLVYYQVVSNVVAAIAKEKELKKLKREWQHKKIREKNPDWRDLSFDLEA